MLHTLQGPAQRNLTLVDPGLFGQAHRHTAVDGLQLHALIGIGSANDLLCDGVGQQGEIADQTLLFSTARRASLLIQNLVNLPAAQYRTLCNKPS
ncbi:hypothetical protein D3C80_638490 [compost metagenome]